MPRYLSEISALTKLALPVALTQLAVMGMMATDVLIAGHAGTLELAGMNLGGNTWNMLIMFFMGIGFATQPLVAERFGAQDDQGIKHQLHQSIWLGLACGLVATLAVLLAAWALRFAPFEAQMLKIACNYILVISLCAIPMAMIPAVRGTLEGMGLTRVVFIVNLGIFLVNIPLDYVLVHGHFGFPKLGGVGCAWATVFLIWSMLAITVGVLKFHTRLKAKRLFNDFERPHKAALLKTFRLGLPIGLSIVIELSMFSGAGMLIALLGPIQTSAHAVAITVAALSFMLYMGLGQGVTIRASQFLGARKPNDAWYTIKVGTIFNLMISSVICALFLIFNEFFIRLFSSDPEVIAVAVVLLYFGAAFQIADCLQVALICALRAYQDTSSPVKYQFVAFLIFGLPLGVGFTFYDLWPGLEGAKGMWFAMVVSLTLVGLSLTWRLLSMRREAVLRGRGNHAIVFSADVNPKID